MSNLFISRTEVLGILGAVIGLDGYAQSMFKSRHKAELAPLFYEELGSLNVAIIPHNSHPIFFNDCLIHRPMHSVNTNGALMVKMTGLAEPRYTIIIHQGGCTKARFEELSYYLGKGWAEHVPYMGKNQFPIEITNVEQVQLSKCGKTNVIHSLCPVHHIASMPRVRAGALTRGDHRHYVETLKNYKTPGSPEIIPDVTVWSTYEMELTTDVYTMPSGQHLVFI